MTRTINMRDKADSFIVNVHQLRLTNTPLRHVLIGKDIRDFADAMLQAKTEREHLKTTTIGKRWPIPGHELTETALALHHLVRTRFRPDALELITFGRHAQRVDIAQLTGLAGVWGQGTNLHHALLLAGRHLRRHPDAAQVLLVVTDGEPTAHLEPDGEAVFSYPPLPQTLALTVREMDGLDRNGTAVSIVMLGHDPRLAGCVHALARRCGGRVLEPGVDGLGAAVVFEGRVADIRDAYAAGHVVVLSSVSEGFPYTVIEAMTCGRACVATDVGGVTEALADTGVVVPPRDPDALGQACLALLQEPTRRRELGAAARLRALELFTVDRAVDTFDGIYTNIAGRSLSQPGQPAELLWEATA